MTSRRHAPLSCRGFTLVDVLVSLGVMALLIAIMLPAMGSARSVAERVACSSNLRQIGIALVLYADANRDQLPPSVMSGSISLDRIVPPNASTTFSPSIGDSIAMRFDIGSDGRWWDSLGKLYEASIIETPELFYCPSHGGPHTFDRQRDNWRNQEGLVVGNYQYRGASEDGITRFSLVQPSRTVLASDTFRSVEELNHDDGFNTFRADLSVNWVSDSLGHLAAAVPEFVEPLTEASIKDIASRSEDKEARYLDIWKALQSDEHRDRLIGGQWGGDGSLH